MLSPRFDFKLFTFQIQPNNIFLSNNYELLQLGDFGISHLYENTDCTCAGVAPYMAPELLNQEPYTNKVDVWSTGCVFYEMANLKMMWYSAPPGQRVAPPAMIGKVCRNIDTGKYENFDQDCPEKVKEIILKATKNDSNERPTAEELYRTAKLLQPQK